MAWTRELSTLQQAKYYLKTSNGISQGFYSHCSEFPIYGTGQGSGNSPCIWLFISSTLFDVHESQSHGLKFMSPDGTMSLRLSMVGFVDDATGSCNDFQPSSQVPLDRLFDFMQTDAQIWNDLLHCSGGKLELAKCSFHLLHFQFLPTGRPIPVIDRHDDKIRILDIETNTFIPIPSKRSFEPHKTLGHYKAPSAIQNDIQYLRQKAQRLAMVISNSPITRYGARLAYWTIYVPSVKYTLPQSFFSRTTLDQAQAASHSKLIAKVGFNRNTARAIIYAPTSYAGAGFVPWYLLQGEGQITNFLKHWRTNTIVSKALRLAVCWSQWQAGTSISIFQDVLTPLPYLECRWLRSLRGFLSTVQGSIRLDHPYTAACERLHDLHIMDYANACGLFSDEDLTIINYCRLYLHITTVSELLDAAGRSIIPSLFHCRREPWFNPQTYVTLQRRPSEYQVRHKWQRLCRQWFNSQGHLAQSMRFGKWLFTGDRLRRRRETYIPTVDSRVIYHWKFGRYYEYRQSPENPLLYHLIGPTDWLPTTPCYPTSVSERGSATLLIDQVISNALPSPGVPVHTSFDDYVRLQPAWVQHLISGIHFRYSPYELVHHLQQLPIQSSLYLVSDGSQRAHWITYGWVLGNSHGIQYAEHSGYCFGTATSHRAEAWGALSAALFLLHLQKYTRTPLRTADSPPIYGLSDNSGLITRINKRFEFSTVFPNATLLPDWDLVEQLHDTISQLAPTTIQYAWVRGHQDDITSDLTVEAQFNIRADALAGSVVIDRTIQSSTAPWILPAEKCQLILTTRSIHGHYIQEIREAYTLPPLFSYLTARHSWSPQTVLSIDWEVFSQAARNTSIPLTQLTKLVYDKLPTRYEVAKSNPHTNPRCPFCAAPETFTHITQCHNDVSRKFRDDLLASIRTYMISKDVPDGYQSMFLSSARNWMTQTTTNVTLPTPFLQIERSQDRIGWTLLPKGFLSSTWRIRLDKEIQRYTANEETRSKDLLAGVLGLIWKAQIQLWTDYLQATSVPTPTISIRLSAQKAEYAARIRHLHQQRSQCLAAHKDLYFHDDVESFIASAPLHHLKAYLHHYEPAIRHSLSEASKISTRSLFSFVGFTRRSHVTRPDIPRASLQDSAQSAPRTAPTPHQQSRWTSLSNIRNSIRNYFQPVPHHHNQSSTTSSPANHEPDRHNDSRHQANSELQFRIHPLSHSTSQGIHPPTEHQSTPVISKLSISTPIPKSSTTDYPRLNYVTSKVGTFPHKHTRWKRSSTKTSHCNSPDTDTTYSPANF